MASYMMGDEMMGAFLPGLFSAKLASKTIAKFDPTSAKAKYGKVIKAGVIGGLNFIPVIGTGLSVAAGTGFMMKSGLDQAKRVKQLQAAQQQKVITNASVPSPAAPLIDAAGVDQSGSAVSTGSTGSTDTQKKSILPILGIGAAAVAALTMM